MIEVGSDLVGTIDSELGLYGPDPFGELDDLLSAGEAVDREVDVLFQQELEHPDLALEPVGQELCHRVFRSIHQGVEHALNLLLVGERDGGRAPASSQEFAQAVQQVPGDGVRQEEEKLQPAGLCVGYSYHTVVDLEQADVLVVTVPDDVDAVWQRVGVRGADDDPVVLDIYVEVPVFAPPPYAIGARVQDSSAITCSLVHGTLLNVRVIGGT